MNKRQPVYNSVDAYIQTFPEDVQTKLTKLREIIMAEAPHALEKISYRMPGYFLNGYFVFFAGHEKHIGFYPLESAMKAFKKELAQYKTSKGTIQFPHDKPLPVELITRIVKHRIQKNQRKDKKKVLKSS